jgi:hypothetical protein
VAEGLVCHNTIIKMARKRAIVDAVLLVTGASALFTQDQDDAAQVPEAVAVPQPTPAPAGPPFGEAASDAGLKQTRAAIAYLFGCEPDDLIVTAALTRTMDLLGKVGFGKTQPYVPYASAIGISCVATELKSRREAGPKSEVVLEPEPPMTGDPALETDEEKVEREKGERIAEEHGDMS